MSRFKRNWNASIEYRVSRLKNTPSVPDFDPAKLDAYINALGMLALAEKKTHPKNHVWAHRLFAMEQSRSHKRYAWLRWVEQNKDSIRWCGELVAASVTVKLKGNT